MICVLIATYTTHLTEQSKLEFEKSLITVQIRTFSYPKSLSTGATPTNYGCECCTRELVQMRAGNIAIQKNVQKSVSNRLVNHHKAGETDTGGRLDRIYLALQSCKASVPYIFVSSASCGHLISVRPTSVRPTVSIRFISCGRSISCRKYRTN